MFIAVCYKRLIVRSSALQEDGWRASNAGEYITVPNVNSGSRISLTKSINNVISSYRNSTDTEHNQVLVQEFLDNLNVSGVALTCQLETGAPYTIFNFQDTKGSSERVTSGISQDDRTIILFNKNKQGLKKFEPKLESVRKAINELKALLSFDKLDVEFAIDRKGLVNILQVRPITVDHRFYDDVSNLFEIKLNELSELFTRFESSSNSLLGNKTVFSNMSDWNPAEIIGTHPNPLAFSLYRFLITDEIWSKQREEFGYRKIKEHPLIVSFSGQPYVDLRASFNSFIPSSINEKLAEKLINIYLDNLLLNPEFHDKIEFDIAFTSWTPTFYEQAKKRLLSNGVSPLEVAELEDALKKITLKAIKNFKTYKNIQNLSNRRNNILKSKNSKLKKSKSLLIDCKRNGTLGFAHAARLGFIAVSFLKSFVHKKIFTKDEIDKLMSSIIGVSSKMQKDQIALKKGNISFKEIIRRYGHLRPGTYDASTFAYWEDPEYYLKFQSISKNPQYYNFKLSKKHKNSISKLLENFKFPILPETLLKFIKDAIILREETKLEFTRNLSSALDCLVDYGEQIGLTRNEVTFLEFNDLQDLIDNKFTTSQIKKLIKSRMKIDKLNRMFEIPIFIKNKKDFLCFEQYDAQINYITNKKIIGELINLNIRNKDQLKGKIILLKQADPGYDWIFSSNIGGLITQYGGANSHMAIRAAELGLPAAIGIGSKLYDKLLKTRKIKLDCGNDNIIIIN